MLLNPAESASGEPRVIQVSGRISQQSRRDNLESLAYILIYFYRGSLPWQGLRVTAKNDKYAPIRDKKRSISITELCAGLPEAFSRLLTYVRSLRFDERPDYAFYVDCSMVFTIAIDINTTESSIGRLVA